MGGAEDYGAALLSEGKSPASSMLRRKKLQLHKRLKATSLPVAAPAPIIAGTVVGGRS